MKVGGLSGGAMGRGDRGVMEVMGKRGGKVWSEREWGEREWGKEEWGARDR